MVFNKKAKPLHRQLPLHRTMYLHILDKYGHRVALINTRKGLSYDDAALLVPHIVNRDYERRTAAHRDYLALPGKPAPYGQPLPPDRFHGVGVLSAHSNLNALPRFTGSGEVKGADIPKQIRGQALIDYIGQLTQASGAERRAPSEPPRGGGRRADAWTSETAPRRASKVSAAIKERAHELRARGISWRKLAAMVGINQSTLRLALS